MIKKFFIISGLFAFLGIAAQQKHTVVKGDNPTSIAKKYGMTLDEFIRMNPSAKSGNIQIGQVFTVKGKAAAKSAPQKAVETVKKSTETGKIILAPKQTIYGITKQYHISEADLRKLNPDLDSHMKVDDEVILPLESIKKYGDKNVEVKAAPVTKTTEEKPVQQIKTPVGDTYLTYDVKEGDTVFGILNKFGVTLDQLLELNPELANGLKAGMTLKIKKQAESAYAKKDNNALGVVLMLPFGFDSNDTKFRNMSLDFLSGAKLAIERNAKLGQRLDVKVVDAGNEASFKNALSQINKDNTDLIIGPFFKSNVLQVLDYVGQKKIPIVAPFANSEDLYGFDNLIIMETGNDVYADKIVKEISQVYADQKIYILTDADKKNATAIENGLKKSLKNPEVVIVTSAQDIQPEKNMMTGQNAPVIAVLATEDDNVGAAFASRVIEISKNTAGNKAFSMFYHPAFEKKVNELSQANLVYLMDRKINKDGDFEKEILADYKKKYCKTPTKYSVIGFDVLNDMLTRENKYGEIFKQMGKSQTHLATKFEYARAKNNGAYVNTGSRVVRLVPQ